MNIGSIASIIADSLSKITEHEFIAIVNSIRDEKFPIYVIHKVTVYSFDELYKFTAQKRVHSKEQDKESIIRALLIECLADILRAAGEGKLHIKKDELRY